MTLRVHLLLQHSVFFRIEAAKEIAHTVARSSNNAYLSADTLMLNLMDQSSTAQMGAGLVKRS
jgi:hypothetical protein